MWLNHGSRISYDLTGYKTAEITVYFYGGVALKIGVVNEIFAGYSDYTRMYEYPSPGLLSNIGIAQQANRIELSNSSGGASFFTVIEYFV